VLYENEAGTAIFEYDRPSTLFGQHGDERVIAVTKEFGEKIYGALIKAATGGLNPVREEASLFAPHWACQVRHK
jgi:hypothetical protein